MIKAVLLLITMILIAGCTSRNVIKSDKGAEAQSHYKIIRHDLKVVLNPDENRLTAEDTITLNDSLHEISFILHKGLNPSSSTADVHIIQEAEKHEGVPVESFKVRLPSNTKTFTLRYNGTINHTIENYGKEEARGLSQSDGIISKDGVYLDAASFWYPVFNGALTSFSLQVELPPEWDAVSQGERLLHVKDNKITRVQWEEPAPQEEIYLIAARFNEYTKPAGSITAMAFLRTPDKELADKYLDATERYIAMYEDLIGQYPYKKFALVENLWETGFGMPSFTMLGPKVIRLPFIINSSYPHEILHNWWGNSVFPDYKKGNWTEGLTAYLSDYLIKEQQNSGAEYRMEALQKYADYVSISHDFPLTEFRMRHSAPSEAIGYGKSLMFFHMLRMELGDKVFINGLRDFYNNNKFRLASFNDLKDSFERVSGRDMSVGFKQWITRAGAPEIRLKDVKAQKEKEVYLLTAVIEQAQSGPAYHLQIPVAITMQGMDDAYQTILQMDKKRFALKLHLPSMPLRIDIDPEFDIFRRLDRRELPPAFSQALGAKKILFILPSSANHTMLQAYNGFAKTLKGSGHDAVEIKLDREFKKIPSDYAVILLGWENRFLNEIISSLSELNVSINEKNIKIVKEEILREGHSVMLTARNPENKDLPLTLIASDSVAALPGLARKLPHYHKYSYLGFKGDEPVNVAKGRWPVQNSPMAAFIADEDGRTTKVDMGRIKKRQPLAEAEAAAR